MIVFVVDDPMIAMAMRRKVIIDDVEQDDDADWDCCPSASGFGPVVVRDPVSVSSYRSFSSASFACVRFKTPDRVCLREAVEPWVADGEWGVVWPRLDMTLVYPPLDYSLCARIPLDWPYGTVESANNPVLKYVGGVT